jgi:biotin carboxylase
MALGTNDIRAAIKLAIGEKLDLDDVTPKFKKYSMSRPLFPKKGKVTKIEGIEEALKINGVKHVILRGKVGDIIENYKNCVTRFCFILAVANTIEEVNKICDKAEKVIKIVME